MYAKLVTQANTMNSNVFYQTLVQVITGTISNTSQLNANVFNQAASGIVTTNPSGWYIVNSQPSANLTGGGTLPPTMLGCALSDDANKTKFLWVGQVSASPNLNIQWVSVEGFNNTTITAANSMFGTPNAPSASYFPTIPHANTTWYSCPNHTTSTSSGTVTYISASTTHLFVFHSSTLTGTYNGYIHHTEFSRDDTWNTVTNSYPPFLFEGGGNGDHTYNGKGVTNMTINTSTVHNAVSNNQGIISRWIDPATKTVYAPYLMRHTGGHSWGITTRFRGVDIAQTTAGGLPGGLIGVANSSNFYGYTSSTSYYLDSALNYSFPLGELRVTNGGGSIPSAYGSITAKAPYIYAFAQRFNNLDEIIIGSTAYTYIYPGTATAGGALLIKQA